MLIPTILPTPYSRVDKFVKSFPTYRVTETPSVFITCKDEVDLKFVFLVSSGFVGGC